MEQSMRKFLIGITALLWIGSATAATLLPNGQQQFFLANGAPAVGGKVYTYVPGTSSPKTTWKDAGQIIANTNPIILDASGSAVIYGSGSYREVVYDSEGNLIFDRVTADTASVSGNSFVGIIGGTANALSTSASNFSNVSGQTISFYNASVNTGAVTITVNGNTYPILKDTAAGPAPLTGGELTPGGISTIWYDDSIAAFHYTVTSVIGGPYPGEIRMFAMNTCPTGWSETDGAAISRTGNSGLFSAIGTTWGPGNGSTTFNKPDLRGTVPRAWDHGRGLDPAAPAFAAYQGDSFASHTHTITDPGHTHDMTQYGEAGAVPPAGVTFNTQVTGATSNVGHIAINSATTGITGTNAAGAAETRAKSTIVLYCIKL
jgi:microcystin-dependent protein